MVVSGIIFDMDGVVFDSESLWKRGYELGNIEFGVELTEKWRQSICGKSEAMIREEMKEQFPGLDVNAYRDYIMAFVRDEIEAGRFSVKAGFLNAVTHFKEYGMKIALATSSYRNRAESMFSVKGMDIDDIFDACSFLEDVGARSKPDPYIFKITADKMGVPYDQCVVLEDSINGIHAAVNAGMIPIHVRDLIAPDDFLKEHCFALVDSLDEVIKLI